MEVLYWERIILLLLKSLFFLLRILPFSACFWGAEQLQELLGAQNIMNHQDTEALGSLKADSLSHNVLVTLLQPSPHPHCAPPALVWVPCWPRARHPQLLLPCQDNLITNPVSSCFLASPSRLYLAESGAAGPGPILLLWIMVILFVPSQADVLGLLRSPQGVSYLLLVFHPCLPSE